MSRYETIYPDVKKGRIRLTHDVHLPDGTIVQESLPLVIGVIADLAGDFVGGREPFRDAGRGFVRITSENFNEVLAGAKPRIVVDVPDVIAGQGRMEVTLEFKELDHFHPDHVVQKIPELAEPLRVRKTLTNLRNLIASDPRLQAQLEEILLDAGKRAAFLDEMAGLVPRALAGGEASGGGVR